MTVITAFQRLRWEDGECEASLRYMARHHLRNGERRRKRRGGIGRAGGPGEGEKYFVTHLQGLNEKAFKMYLFASLHTRHYQWERRGEGSQIRAVTALFCCAQAEENRGGVVSRLDARQEVTKVGPSFKSFRGERSSPPEVLQLLYNRSSQTILGGIILSPLLLLDRILYTF